jgi:hypothetical protein
MRARSPKPTESRMYRTVVCAFLLAGVLAGCKPDLPVEPQGPKLPNLSGEWSYTASEMRLAGSGSGSSCDIEGVVLTLNPWTKDGFTGRTAGGFMKCTGDLTLFSGPQPSYPILGGGYVLLDQPYVAFSISSNEWRNEGVLSADTTTMSGAVRLRSGGIEFTGKFLAVRRTGP